MKKSVNFLKRLLAVVLSVALLFTTVVVTGIITSTATGEETDTDTHDIYPFYRHIDFSQYVVQPSTNSWYQTSREEPYWTKKTDDATADGGAYIHYDSSKKVGTWWEGNHAFAPSKTGDVSDIVLPNSTTFTVTLRLRAIDFSKTEKGSISPFVIYGSSLSAANSASSVAAYSQKTKITDSNAVLTADDTDWKVLSFTFTTPAEYKGPEGSAVYNKCFIGFYPGSEVYYSYDIDYVTIAAVNTADTRVVDFSSYNVAATGLFGPNDGPNTAKKDTWAHVKKDDTLLGGSYLEYKASVEDGLTGWGGHYNLPLTVNGSVVAEDAATNADGAVLVADQKYRFTIRMRVNDAVPGTHLYYVFTSGQTKFDGLKTIKYLSVTDGWVEYSTTFTPTAEVIESTANKFYFGITNGGTGNLCYDIDYVMLEKIETINVTYNANGGKFGETETVTENVVVGDEIKPEAVLSAPDRFSVLAGWSTSADGANLSAKITADMADTTLYAVWVKDAHLGGYDDAKTVITFKDYSVSSQNSYTFNNGTSTVYYWTKNPVADDTTEDGNYLRYEATNGQASNWLGNHAMVPSITGEPVILPNGVTYKMTLRLRTQNIPESGMYPFIAYCDSIGRGYSSIAACKYQNFAATSMVYDTNKEWTNVTIQFTTPDEYAYNGENIYNKFYFGFYTGTSRVNYSYDVDTITLEQITTTSFYVDSDGNGEYELYDSVKGVPGTDLTVPASVEIKENYNADGTGYLSLYNFSNWYSDEECSKNAVLKFGNCDVDLYCKPVVTTTGTEGQVGFVGFDKYSVIAENTSLGGAEIVTEEAYSGTSSVKFALEGGDTAIAQLKNEYDLDIRDGKSYKVSFKYMSDNDFTATLATGEIINVAKGSNVKNCASLNLAATDGWQSASLIVNADALKKFDRGLTLALVIGAAEKTTVYVDTVTVSTVTEAVTAVKTENGIRFMMTYNCGGDNNLVIEGETYNIAEHGVLVTGAENSTELVIDNAGVNGVMIVTNTDLSKYYARNGATNATTYSVLLDGLNNTDTYDFTARGYVKFTNGDVYYTDYITSSAADAQDDEFDAIVFPAEAILTGTSAAGNPYETTARDTTAQSYFTFLPAGTTFYSEKTYKVERWRDLGTSWISPNYDGTGTYVLPTDAYCELTIWNGTLNDDLHINVPVESKYKVHAGFKDDIRNAEINAVFEKNGSSAMNYIFISDVHTGAFLRNSSLGTNTVYEDKSIVNSREKDIIRKMTAIVDFANTNSNIDFIVIGGDLVNGYETPDSPLYQEALAAGKVTNIREFVISQIQAILAPLKNSTKPVFVLMGNHDDNRGQSLYYSAKNAANGTSNPTYQLSEIISDRDWYNGVIKEFVNVDIVQDENYTDTNGDKLSKYYYYDYEKNGEKKRVICLDDMDTRNAMDENGQITEYNQDRRMAFSDDEIKWLANVLKTAEGDVTVVCHQGTDSATHGAYNGNVVRELLGAYQNKTSYKNDTLGINVDFSNGPAGHIVAYHAGHDHADQNYYTTGANYWQMVSTSSAQEIVSATDVTVHKFAASSYNDAKLMYPELP